MEKVNPVEAFEDLVLKATPIGLNKKGKPDYDGLFKRVESQLSARTAEEQFRADVALWYGYLVTDGGEKWKKEMMRRVFALLHSGGLLVNRGGETGWITWASQELPLCSAVSHTARVLVWLPPGSDEEFLGWLWAGHKPQSRMAASHGIAANTGEQEIEGFPEARKGVIENKSGSSCQHFGVNIALGGNGNKNPVSGKVIAENGKHGHLYIAVWNESVHNRKAILIGVEQSSPIDRQVAVKGWAGPLKSFGSRKMQRWVPDQYGGGHGVGGHSRFSATGGDDFNYESNGQLAPTNIGDYGPGRGHYYDGMYIDLTLERFSNVCEIANQRVNEIVAEF